MEVLKSGQHKYQTMKRRANSHQTMKAWVLETSVQTFPFEKVNDALIALKHDAIRGAAVIEIKEY